MNRLQEEKPTIHLLYDRSIEEERFKQILFGIEEEDVPCSIEKTEESSALELGYKAANHSKLSIGIGIGADQMAILHYAKLNKNEPLFQVDMRDRKVSLRAFGANAARLVKGLPFKDLTDEELVVSEQAESYSKQEEAILKEKIASIVRKILSEGD